MSVHVYALAVVFVRRVCACVYGHVRVCIGYGLVLGYRLLLFCSGRVRVCCYWRVWLFLSLLLFFVFVFAFVVGFV